MRQNEETALEAELLPKASWISRVLHNLWHYGSECWEGRTRGILKAHVRNASHTRTQDDTSIPCLSSSQQTSLGCFKPEMALVIRCELTHSKKLAWATRPSAVLSDCTLEVGWGFCKGPQNVPLYRPFSPLLM